MKRIVKILWMIAGVGAATAVHAQIKIDEQRMQRDIEIAENVLSTLVKQQFGKRNFFPFEVEGNYTPGYGVTFRLPMDFGGPMMFQLGDEPNIIINNGPDGNYSYSISGSTPAPDKEKDCEDCEKVRLKAKTATSRGRASNGRRTNSDSLNNMANQKIIEASKNFMADYGDLISQLSVEERIMITNRHEGQRFWFAGVNTPKRKFISLESSKADHIQYKQGKLTRDQFIAKIHVINSETSDELTPDLELLSSILNRLYQSDLSKSYFTEENIYYERLKDFGVIYYMQVYSCNVKEFKKYDMPTIDLEDVDEATRDKKVKELYPVFEKDIKESMLDYGRTLKSLKDDEMLVFNIKLTRCEGCGIPSSLELSVKNAVLNDFSTGKLTMEAALAKINSKKGPNQ